MVQATHLPGLKTNPDGSWNQSHRIFVLLPLLWKEKFRRVRSTNEKLAPLFSLPGVLLAGGRGLYWKDSWFVKSELMLDCIIDIVQGFCMVLSQVITPYISHIHHGLETYGIADIIWRHNVQWIHDIQHTTFISMSWDRGHQASRFSAGQVAKIYDIMIYIITIYCNLFSCIHQYIYIYVCILCIVFRFTVLQAS